MCYIVCDFNGKMVEGLDVLVIYLSIRKGGR